MKLTFRTVSGESFQLDAEDSTTVGDLKAAVEQQRNIARDTLKLVYRGKVLDDDAAAVGVSNINEQGFIVVFVSKKPEAAKPVEAAPTPAPAAAAPAASSAPAPAAEPTSATAAAPADAAPAPAAPAPAAPAAAEPNVAIGSFLTGTALEAAISGICEMGFDRTEVMQAMRAAFNNPERAVEYLTTGIPASAAPPPPPAAAPAAGVPVAGAAAPAQPATGPAALPFNMFGGPAAAGGAGAGAGGPAGAMEALRNTPQFQLLRESVRGNPGLLTPMLQELGRAYPHLIQLIQGHQAEFLRILQEEPGEGEMDALGALAGMAGGEGDEGGMIQVELTEEDMAKVERLQALGFQRDACIEALLACDRNEELAANFLAEQMFD